MDSYWKRMAIIYPFMIVIAPILEGRDILVGKKKTIQIDENI